MKIDIQKAFDTMHWSFIFSVFKAFAFSTVLINRLHSIFNYARLSVLVNGSPMGYFSCNRGGLGILYLL